ncbi:hypothetical protein DICVIV_02916 [Dictyocaulus viviparus]|uniref:Uncharacterized protein n=1 Tax=Dictyocaulus viviparus TaxID=29172 RepID=A0A0D8Y2M3_DICVI|nr:hypothetical protein DICVIV_02916 [Dictyocaulus viviparus]
MYKWRFVTPNIKLLFRELAHFPHASDTSPEIQEAPDDSLYDVKVDAFDCLENGYTIEGSRLMGDTSNTSCEPKFEMKDDTMQYDQALVTVMSENDAPRLPRKPSNSPSPAIASTSAQGSTSNPTPPPAKRMRIETRSGGTSFKPTKDPAMGFTQNERESSDKYDKYAAFVSTTLREMPEIEAKRRMREMTMLLLEDVDLNV